IRFWQLADGSCLHTMGGDNSPVNAAALSADKGMAISGDQAGALKLWIFDWSLTPPSKINPQDDALGVIMQNFVRQHTPYPVLKPDSTQQNQTITKPLQPRWNDKDLQRLLVILGYADFSTTGIASLNALLDNYRQETKPDSTETSEQHTTRPSKTSTQTARTTSTPVSSFNEPGFLAGLPRPLQLILAGGLVLLIGLTIYHSSIYVMTYFSLKHATEYVESGQNINRLQEDGMALLHTAARKGQLRVVSYLLQQHANINALDSIGWTALHHAVYSNDLAMVELLLENGAVRNHGAGMKNVTPTFLASQEGYEDIVRALVRRR
ncbi:MAG: ankyrin repeat domain-containing protein, partial [Gammaproteobacteria bacterium]|nr:ankyrin repeat domain-containing protein [Gammaproteobacteria bacterium]